MMRTYAETLDCRRRVLLELLGEAQSEPCGRCDSCERGTSREVEDAPFRLAERVEHPEWGSGTVTLVEDDRITVMFDEHGYKTLATALVEDSDLLTRAPTPAG
jgi:ATP-dependent DNA helicase RecQ